MRKFETPLIELLTDSKWIGDYKTIVVTLTDTKGTWRKSFSTTDGTIEVTKSTGSIIIKPAQADTADAPEDTMVIAQVNVLTKSGARYTSDPAKFPLLWNSYEEVMV